jgi:hypothetical protein
MSGRWSATRGAPRVLRGATLAVCCSALGVAGHATAGGALPAFGSTVLLTTLLAGAGIALADRQRGPLAIMSAVAGTQLVMHVSLDVLVHHPGSASGEPVAMTGLHAAAALVTWLLLTGAEGAVFAIVDVLGWLLRRVAPLATTPAAPAAHERTPARLLATPALSPLLQVLLRRVHQRRGPPVLA